MLAKMAMKRTVSLTHSAHGSSVARRLAGGVGARLPVRSGFVV
jgi:hypothetical protein